MADLQSRREERDPLFFALVMSTVASTCVQVPRSYLPLERREVRKLAQNCHEASRHISVASYDPPTSTHVVIRYLCVEITILTIYCAEAVIIATLVIIFVKDMMQHHTLLSARRRISLSHSTCTKRLRMKDLTLSSARSADESFGYCLMVSFDIYFLH